MSKQIKVLHVFNTAGVSNVLNHFINYFYDNNYKSNLITRLYYEKFSFSDFYNDKVIKRRNEIFFSYLFLIAKKYDILHFNTDDRIIPMVRKVFRNKKIILSYHGTDIRDKVNEREEYYKHADFVSVSTSELKQNIFEHIPNLVDFFHFDNFGKEAIIKDEAVFFYLSTQEVEAYEKVKTLIRNSCKNINLTVLKRWKNPIFYKDMPNFLSRFEYFFDVKMVYSDKKTKAKDGYLTPYDKSYTAEQFLTMDTYKKVIDKNGSITEGYTRPQAIKRNFKILDKWIDIYESI